jgi:hypothetical protein
MAPKKLSNVGKKMSRSLALCIKPTGVDFRTGEKPASLYFFSALELDGPAIRLGKE